MGHAVAPGEARAAGPRMVTPAREAQARRSEQAPANAALRLLRRQTAAPHGGFGGRRLQRHFIHSRFRRAAPAAAPLDPAEPRLQCGSLFIIRTMVAAETALGPLRSQLMLQGAPFSCTRGLDRMIVAAGSGCKNLAVPPAPPISEMGSVAF